MLRVWWIEVSNYSEQYRQMVSTIVDASILTVNVLSQENRHSSFGYFTGHTVNLPKNIP